MKAYKKYISLFLSFLFILMSFNGAFANTNSDKVEPSTNVISKVEKLDESEVPVLLDYEEMVEKGHIERLYSEEQEMNSAVFKNEDGTNTLYIFNEDIKYVDSEGVTKDKSNKLTKTKTGYINLENDIRVLYPDNIDDGVTVTHGKYIITMTPVLDTTRKNKPVAKLNTQSKSHKIEYASTFDENIRIEYIQSLSGMKEAIILEKDCGVTQFDFSLKTNGLQVIANKQTLAFYDATNKEFVGEISPVVIWDANGKMGSGSYKLSTVKENEEYRITVVADDFLKNNDIKYPVTIDPSYNISGSNAIDDATIFSNNSQNVGNSGNLYIGNYSAWTQWTYYDGIGRTLVKFPGLDADALFRMICLESRIITMKYNFADMFSTAPSNTIQAYVASQSWNENTVVYNSTIWTPGNFVDSVSVSQMTSTPSPRRRYTIDFTDAYFSETGFSSKGLLLKASNENAVAMVICSNEYDSTYSTTGNAPYIEIAYHNSKGWMDGKIFTIYNEGTNNYLSVADSYDYNKQNVIVHNTYTLSDVGPYCDSTPDDIEKSKILENLNAGQQFRMIYDSNEQAYTIAPISSMNGSVKSRVIDVLYKTINNDKVVQDGCNIDIYNKYTTYNFSTDVDSSYQNNLKAQHFILTQCGKNVYIIRLKYFSNFVLTANAGNGGDNRIVDDPLEMPDAEGNVYVKANNNLDSQKWVFTEQTTAEAIEAHYSAMNLRYPLSGNSFLDISSDFGLRSVSPYNHGGIDIPTSNVTSVYSAFDGKVIEIGNDKTRGGYVIIESSDYHVYGDSSKPLYLVYMHLSKISNISEDETATNNTVTTNTKIGETGSDHLHFGILDNYVEDTNDGHSNTTAEYAIDPMYFFGDYGLYDDL